MKKIIASAASAVLLAGAIVATAAAPASAHTPTASATCEAISINATYYDGTRPAQGEERVEVANPDYVPATPGSPAVGTPTIVIDNPDYVPAKDAVYETVVTEREYKKWKVWWWDVQWFPAEANPGGWTPTGNVRTEEVLVTPAQPAVGEPTITSDNPDYVPAVPATPAIGEPTIWIDNPDYVPADSSPNAVSATVDGEVVLSESFGSSYSATIPLDKYTAHDWSVTNTAWNDADGSKGWTKTISGTTTACAMPEKPEPQVSYGEWGEWAVDCEAYTAERGRWIYTNDWAFNAESGEWELIEESVVTSETQTREATAEECPLPEKPEAIVVTGEWTTGDYECGDTTVTETREVTTTDYVLEGREWIPGEPVVTTEERTRDLTDEEIEALDCAVVTPPTDDGDEEPTPAPKPVKAAAVAQADTADTLAITGGESMVGFLIAALAMIAAGAAGVAIRRRRA